VFLRARGRPGTRAEKREGEVPNIKDKAATKRKQEGSGGFLAGKRGCRKRHGKKMVRVKDNERGGWVSE